jgi:hypothetical protein
MVHIEKVSKIKKKGGLNLLGKVSVDRLFYRRKES